jgi:hypothetical protein
MGTAEDAINPPMIKAHRLIEIMPHLARLMVRQYWDKSITSSCSKVFCDMRPWLAWAFVVSVLLLFITAAFIILRS